MPRKTPRTPYAEVDFEEVDHAEVPEGRAGRGQLGPASLALLAGKTIWMAGDRNRANRFMRMAKPRGYRVHTRGGVRNGAQGTYIWLEGIDAQE